MRSAMAELEAPVEDYLVKQVEALGGQCYKFAPPGRVGYPDRLVVLPGGRMFFVELKRPKGGRLGVLQPQRHEELRALGVAVYVVRNRGEVDACIATEGRLVDIRLRAAGAVGAVVAGHAARINPP